MALDTRFEDHYWPILEKIKEIIEAITGGAAWNEDGKKIFHVDNVLIGYYEEIGIYPAVAIYPEPGNPIVPTPKTFSKNELQLDFVIKIYDQQATTLDILKRMVYLTGRIYDRLLDRYVESPAPSGNRTLGGLVYDSNVTAMNPIFQIEKSYIKGYGALSLRCRSLPC